MQKSWIYPLICFLITLIVYIVFAGRFKFQFPTDPANYFSYLSLSLLHGRLDLINPAWDHDLSLYRGKLYLYWGPTPVLFILPLVILFGVNFSDILYTVLFASLTPLFIYLSLTQMEKLNLIKLANIKKLMLCLFFAFGTVYFSVAVRGGVWFTSQVFSTLYIIVAFYLIFKYLLSQNTLLLFLSATFLGLGIWGRATFIFYLLPFFTLLYIYNGYSFKQSFRKFIQFSIPLIFIALLAVFYNYARFGSPFEEGYRYQNNLSPMFETLIKQYRQSSPYLSPRYIPVNFYYNFIHLPQIQPNFPFFIFDSMGNSFLILSPIFLLILLIVKKDFWKNKILKMFNLALINSVLLIVLLELNFWGTGWYQFSARYLLDATPLLILLLAEIFAKVPWFAILLLLLISVIFNSFGAAWLMGMFNV